MEIHEKNMREILSRTQYQLRKFAEQFRFKVRANEGRHWYEVQVLMGRQAFEEIYLFKFVNLEIFSYGKYFHDDWINQIKKNLELNKIFNK